MTLRRQRDLKKEEFWRRMLRREAGSGLSVRAWCLKHNLQPSAFYWWRRELARRLCGLFWLASQTSSSGTAASASTALTAGSRAAGLTSVCVSKSPIPAARALRDNPVYRVPRLAHSNRRWQDPSSGGQTPSELGLKCKIGNGDPARSQSGCSPESRPPRRKSPRSRVGHRQAYRCCSSASLAREYL